MLLKSIFEKNKIISILCIFLLLFSLLFTLVQVNTQAATIDDQLKDFSKYPGYVDLLKKLQTAHPNWKFEIYKTGLDWYEVIIAESTGHHGRNVVPKSKSSAWKCTCGKVVDESWVCASTAAVAYYMDPRNSLNEDYIFQFEKLTFSNQTAEEIKQFKTGVEAILADCKYMQGTIQYYDTKGNKKTINKTYSQVIVEAAQKYNISPYHLASKIKQEQGSGNGSLMITGTYKGHEGYYNYFNVGAFGATTADILNRGLTSAKDYGWTDPEKSINGGAKVLASNYISQGQDTLYFEKFDVVPTGGLYSWQYMTNVSGSKSEGESIREAYRKVGMLSKDSTITFKIPVYENMPTMQSTMPGTEQIVTEDVKVNADKVEVKEGKASTYKTIATLSKNTNILRIELDNSKDAKGKQWDKVVLADGRKGYVMRDYLTKLTIQTNANESYIVSAYTNFRNGPGVTLTTILKLLSPGQMITVVEKGKYKSVDGEEWYRVKTSDGVYGYVGTGYIKPYDPKTSTIDTVKVVCKDGLNIRKEPSSSSTVLKAVAQNTLLTRIEKNVKSSDTKYTWDKVSTSGGVVGYVVREDPTTKQAWIQSINATSSSNASQTSGTISGTGFKSSDTNLLCNPNITVENIKKSATNATIKNGNAVVNSGKVATGWNITANGKTYTVVVKGDVNGDGDVKSTDYMRIKNYIMNASKLSDAQKMAADVNLDGEIKATDYMKIKNYIMGSSNINI